MSPSTCSAILCHGLFLCLLLVAPGPPGARAAEDDFAVQAFSITEVREDTDSGEVEVLWQTQLFSRRSGVHTVQLAIAVEDVLERAICTRTSAPQVLLGEERKTATGSFLLQRDEWFRAEGFTVEVETVATPVQSSGLRLRRLNVLPGSPMAQGDFAPLRWSTVLTNRSATPAATTVRLHLWDADGRLLGSYPVRELQIAPRSKVKLAHLTVVDGNHFRRAADITLDAVAELPPGGP